jgi:ribonuclease P protein component
VFSLNWRIIIYAEANLSTQQSSSRQDARISRADGDQKRPPGAQAAPCQRPQATDSVALLNTLVSSPNLTPAPARQTLPKQNRLSARAEFQKIYAEGQRYDGRLMAAFLRKNDLQEHRLGVTASTKAIGKSVDRNRARRLLREVFRRSRNELNGLEQRYDWVFNAKRSLLSSNEELRFREFRRIVEQVARDERG